MLKFQQSPKEYDAVFLEDTDKPLPEILNANTRYIFLNTLATGGKSLIKSCKDLHLNRVVAYKTLRKEFLDDEIENKRFLRLEVDEQIRQYHITSGINNLRGLAIS